MLAWRITARERALDRSGADAAATGGRWHRPGVPAVVAASTVDLAQREADPTLAEADRVLVRIDAPDDAELVHRCELASLPAGWDADPPSPETVAFGTRLLESHRWLSLWVPSARLPQAYLVVFDPGHPAYADVRFSIEDDHPDACGQTPAAEAADQRALDHAVALTFPASDPVASKPD